MKGNIYRKTSQPQDLPRSRPIQRDITMMNASEGMYQIQTGTNTGNTQMYDDPQQLGYPMDPGSNSYNPDFMSNLPGIDLLNRLGGAGSSAGSSNMISNAGMMQPGSSANIDSTLDESWLDIGPTGSADGDAESEWGLGSGFGVGVGMGLDFGPQHDWSDGQGGFNLFDGFFFGGGDGSNTTM